MSNPSADELISISDMIRIMFRRVWVMVLIVVVAMIVAVFCVNIVVPKYKATTSILVRSAVKNVDPFLSELRVLRQSKPNVTQGEIVKSNLILKEVVSELRLFDRKDREVFYPRLRRIIQPYIDTISDLFRLVYSRIASILGINVASTEDSSKIEAAIESLRRAIRIEQVVDSDIFYITVSDYNPEMASIIANTLTGEYLIFDLQQQIVSLSTIYGDEYPRIVQIREAISSLKKDIRSRNFDNIPSLGLGSVEVIEIASVPQRPYFPKKRLIYILTFVCSLIGGVSLVFLFELMDNTFKEPWEFEKQTGVPVIGSVPRKKMFKVSSLLLNNTEAKDIYTVSIRKITEQVFLIMQDKKAKAILLADIVNSYNSFIDTYNIAYMMAYSLRLNVLVIDADIRAGYFKRYVNPLKEKKIGFSDIIAGKVKCEEAIVSIGENISIIHSGSLEFNPLVLFSRQIVRDIIVRFSERYDVVLINAPALNVYHDAFILSKYVDFIIITLAEAQVKEAIVKLQLTRLLKNISISQIGAIFNNRSRPIPSSFYKKI